jgi:hypothetical protein
MQHKKQMSIVFEYKDNPISFGTHDSIGHSPDQPIDSSITSVRVHIYLPQTNTLYAMFQALTVFRTIQDDGAHYLCQKEDLSCIWIKPNYRAHRFLTKNQARIIRFCSSPERLMRFPVPRSEVVYAIDTNGLHYLLPTEIALVPIRPGHPGPFLSSVQYLFMEENPVKYFHASERYSNEYVTRFASDEVKKIVPRYVIRRGGLTQDVVPFEWDSMGIGHFEDAEDFVLNDQEKGTCGPHVDLEFWETAVYLVMYNGEIRKIEKEDMTAVIKDIYEIMHIWPFQTEQIERRSSFNHSPPSPAIGSP